MANAELYDYFTTYITPDYDVTTLSILPQVSISEDSQKNHVIHYGVDGSEERISFGTSPIFYFQIQWKMLSEIDSGTILDLYNDSAKANGCQRSFKYAHVDGHTYVVRFDCDLSRRGQHKSRYGFSAVKFKVLGRIAD